MMVLVDTSVWLQGLAGKQPYARELRQLLAKERVLTHALVQGELLIGDRGGRKELLSLHDSFSAIEHAAEDVVADLVRTLRLQGTGLSWIDAHLFAAARKAGVPLFTADRALHAVCAQHEMAYTPR